MRKIIALIAIAFASVLGASAQTAPAIGNLTAGSGGCNVANSCVSYTIAPGVGSVTIMVGSIPAFSGTVNFEFVGADGYTTKSASSTDSSPVSSTTSGGIWQFNAGAYTVIRARMYPYTSGTAAITISGSTASAKSNSGGNGGAVSSVFTRTGAVAAQSGDYTCAEVTGCPTAAGGDLSGSYPNPTVAQIEGAAIPTSAAVTATNGSTQFTAATPHQVTLPLQCADTSSSATTYACTTTPSLGALATGDTFIFTSINQNNSGSSTLNIDGIGAKTIKKYQNSANLAAGDLQASASVKVTYDGTNLELDTIGQAPSGSGTVNSCATTGALAEYTGSGTTVGCGNADVTYTTHTLAVGSSGLLDLSAMTSTNFKFPSSLASTLFIGLNSSEEPVAATAANAATLIQGLTGCNTATYIFTPQASDCVPGGVVTNAQTGTTYTYLASDRLGYTTFSNASSIAAGLPQAGTTGFTSNWVNKSCNIGAGTVTITPTTSTISYTNGLTYTSGASSVALATGQCIFIYSDNTNYFANLEQLANLGTPTTLTLTNATGLPTAGLVNNAVTAAKLAAQYSKGSCTEVWGGSGTSFAMTSGDDAIVNNSCYNDSGVTRTITALKCRSDNAANSTVLTPTFGSAGTGTAILTGTVTCGNSYAYSATGTLNNTAWTTGAGIDPGMSTTGNATSIAMIVEYTF